MLARASLFAIYGYQQFLSPRKGFGCAYRIQNGGTGCSGYAKHAIRDHGVLRAIPLIRARFSACKVAAMDMSQRNDEGEDKKKPKQRKSNTCSGSFFEGCMFAGCFGLGSSSVSGQNETPSADPAGGSNTCGDMSCGDASCGDCTPSCDGCACGS